LPQFPTKTKEFQNWKSYSQRQDADIGKAVYFHFCVVTVICGRFYKSWRKLCPSVLPLPLFPLFQFRRNMIFHAGKM